MSNAAQSAEVTRLTDIPRILDQLASVLLGKRDAVELSLACLLARGHLLIEDVPGVGKTTLAHALASTLGLDWSRVQFTSDLLPADVVGVSVLDATSQQFAFRPGPVFTNVLLADEINRAPPKAQSSLLEAMEERQVTVDGVTHPLDEHFFVIATQNPTDQLGAYPLPESQLDRFLVGLELGYPDADTERQLLELGDRRAQVGELQTLANPRALSQWTTDASEIHVAAPLYDYALALITRSRESGAGLSPRAGLNLVRLCKALALIAQRDHVTPDDVQRAFVPLAGHRLTGRVSTGATVAQDILHAVPAP